MIDIAVETIFPIVEAPGRLPSRHGKKINITTVYRWIRSGSRGVKLESIILGGVRYTSTEAIQRFVERVSAAANGETSPVVRSAIQRRNASERAERELAARGA